MTTRRDAPAATVAVLFFTLIFGSLTWFAASSSEAATTPVPCAPGSASCFAAAEGKAAPAATDVPTSPATTPVQTPPDTGGGDQTGSDGGAVSTPGTGGVVPGETGGSGDGNGVTDPDGRQCTHTLPPAAM